MLILVINVSFIFSCYFRGALPPAAVALTDASPGAFRPGDALAVRASA